MNQTIVINSEARVIQIQVAHGQSDGLLQLIPGANPVDSETWAKAKQLQQVRTWLTTPSDNPEAPYGAKILVESRGLPALDEAGADAVLRETFDKKLLGKWLADEERAEIRVQIQHRLDDIEKIEKAAKAAAKAPPA